MISKLPLTNYLSVIFCFVALWLRLGLVGGLCTFGCQPGEKWHWSGAALASGSPRAGWEPREDLHRSGVELA